MSPSLSYVMLFLFVFTTTLIATAAGDIVRDSTGQNVLDNVPYNIAVLGKGGAIKLSDTMNNKKICPYNVVQDPADNLGGEFNFTMVGKGRYLRTSRNLAVDSGYHTGSACEESTFWTINEPEAKVPANLVTTGGGFDSGETCFVVVPYPKPTNPKVHSYMLRLCPSLCASGPDHTCYNISISSYMGQKRLAVFGTPFEFVFHKLA